MAKQSKWYVVWQGHEPGVYDTWEACKQQVEGYRGAKYRGFASRTEALRAYEDGYAGYQRLNYGASSSETARDYPTGQALTVDAACSGNPGVMEYRGVMLGDHREVFRVGPFPRGTNNIGEFLAIVHGLSLLRKHDLPLTIYSDSVSAIAWVRNKRCKTLLERTEETAPLLDLVARAEEWLRANSYPNVILKWDTHAWGEIPADFGRK